MRIYRDTRFAKDKTPYKTNVGIQFRHEAGKDAHAPGFYFHVERSSAFVGAGVWRPPSPVIKKIRAHIDAEPERWRAILAGAPFEASFRLGGGTLKRHPRGYSADHPLIEDIKRTSFIALSDLSVEEITQDGLPERVQERFAAMGDFVRFLCDAIEVPF
jgi:uncharacterized protein (TIGR02453 family)